MELNFYSTYIILSCIIVLFTDTNGQSEETFGECSPNDTDQPLPALRLTFRYDTASISLHDFKCYSPRKVQQQRNTSSASDSLPTMIGYQAAYISKYPFTEALNSSKCTSSKFVLEVYRGQNENAFNGLEYNCSQGYQYSKLFRGLDRLPYIPLLQQASATQVGRYFIEKPPDFDHHPLWSAPNRDFTYVNFELILYGKDYCEYVGISYRRSLVDQLSGNCFKKISQVCFAIETCNREVMSRIFSESKPSTTRKPAYDFGQVRSTHITKLNPTFNTDYNRIILLICGKILFWVFCSSFCKFCKSDDRLPEQTDQFRMQVAPPPQQEIHPSLAVASPSNTSTFRSSEVFVVIAAIPLSDVPSSTENSFDQEDLPPDYDSLAPPPYEQADGNAV